MKDYSGTPIRGPENFSWYDALVKVTGFGLGEESDVYMKRSWKIGQDKRLRIERNKILNSMKRAETTEERRAVRERAQEFNRNLPITRREKWKITDDSFKRGAKSEEKKRRNTVHGISFDNKEKVLIDELRFMEE